MKSKEIFEEMVKKSFLLKGKSLNQEEMSDLLNCYTLIDQTPNKLDNDFLDFARSNSFDSWVVYSKHITKDLYLVYSYDSSDFIVHDYIIGIVREIKDHNQFDNQELDITRYIIPHSTQGYPSRVYIQKDSGKIIKEYLKYDNRDFYWGDKVGTVENSNGEIIDYIYESKHKSLSLKETKEYLPENFIKSPITDIKQIEFLISFKDTLKELATSENFERIRNDIIAPISYYEWSYVDFQNFNMAMRIFKNSHKKL